MNTVSIIILAFASNYLLDISQSLTESLLSIHHFIILLCGFSLQNFVIDRFIIANLKSELNLRLIAKIENKIPELQIQIEKEKEEFNNQVSKYKELHELRIA